MSRASDILNAAAVREALAAATPAPRPAGRLELERAWPGRSCALVATYRDPAGSPAWGRWTLVVPLSERLPASIRRSVRRGDAVSLDPLGAVAFPFPHDPALAHLHALTDARQAGERLDGVPGIGRIESCAVEVLSYKPMRRLVVRYRAARAGTGVSQWIGKALRPGEDERCASAHEALESGRSGRAGPRGFELAVPCGRIDEWNLVVWPFLRGVSFRRILAESDRAVEIAGWIGEALAALQRSRIRWPRHHLVEDELGVVAHWYRSVRRFRPDVAAVIGEAVRGTLLAAVPGDPGRLVPCHRDFYDQQILVDRERTALLDLDTACLADPELDVANFIAHLTLRQRQRDGLTTARHREAFLAAYSRQAGRRAPDRLAFYEACALTRLACVYALRGRDAGLITYLADAARAATSFDRRFAHAT